MKCRWCGSTDTKVVSTDHHKDETKRYCRCYSCGTTYRTIEVYEQQKPGPKGPSKLPHYGKMGEKNHNAVMTEQDIKEIRRLRREGINLSVIAIRYGLSRSTISRIVNRKAWSHVV